MLPGCRRWQSPSWRTVREWRWTNEPYDDLPKNKDGGMGRSVAGALDRRAPRNCLAEDLWRADVPRDQPGDRPGSGHCLHLLPIGGGSDAASDGGGAGMYEEIESVLRQMTPPAHRPSFVRAYWTPGPDCRALPEPDSRAVGFGLGLPLWRVFLQTWH